jgi:hypothetical protein
LPAAAVQRAGKADKTCRGVIDWIH